jgi:spermidine synthase
MEKWFEELLEIKKGRVLKVQYKELLESFQSKYQKIDVYDTIPFGKMLVHDEVVMLTEFDEAHYHEMIAHVPLNVHPNPKNVLVIGGGDGGTIREVLKHPQIENAHLCEIDEAVVRLCQKHLPEISCGFQDQRVQLFFEDGAEFVKQKKNYYDVIIVDSSDPIGPAEVLFQEEFYRSMHAALTEDGIVVTQSESFMYHQDIIKKIANFSRKIFLIYNYYYTIVPTYPSGTIGFSFCSKKYDPKIELDPKKLENLKGLKYYNKDVHKAAFCLPNAFSKLMNSGYELTGI